MPSKNPMTNQNRIAKNIELLPNIIFEGTKIIQAKPMQAKPIESQFAKTINSYINNIKIETKPHIPPAIKKFDLFLFIYTTLVCQLDLFDSSILYMNLL